METEGVGIQEFLVPGDVAQGSAKVRNDAVQLHQLGLLCAIGVEGWEVRHVGGTQLVQVVGKWLPLGCVLRKKSRGEVMRESRVDGPALPPTLKPQFPHLWHGTQLLVLSASRIVMRARSNRKCECTS